MDAKTKQEFIREVAVPELEYFVSRFKLYRHGESIRNTNTDKPSDQSFNAIPLKNFAKLFNECNQGKSWHYNGHLYSFGFDTSNLGSLGLEIRQQDADTDDIDRNSAFDELRLFRKAFWILAGVSGLFMLMQEEPNVAGFVGLVLFVALALGDVFNPVMAKAFFFRLTHASELPKLLDFIQHIQPKYEPYER